MKYQILENNFNLDRSLRIKLKYRAKFLSNTIKFFFLLSIGFNNYQAEDLSKANPKLPQSFRNEFDIEFLRIPAGSFSMGAVESDKLATETEQPTHTLEITKDYYLSKFEITQKQWKLVMKENPSRFQNCGENCPVEKVSWNDANEFIKRINSTSKVWIYDLPTEAEWEYAAKAGESSNAYSGNINLKGRNNSPMLDEISWYGGNSGVSYENGYDCLDWEEKQYKSTNCGTHQVGLKKPNAFGLYDMLGNVWEWCKDGFEADIYSSRIKLDNNKDILFVGEVGERKVLRGGSWSNDAAFIRPTERNNYYPDYRNYNFGIRLLARPKN